MRACRYRNCDIKFKPKTHRQKYCCDKHAIAERNRRYRDDLVNRERLATNKRELRASTPVDDATKARRQEQRRNASTPRVLKPKPASFKPTRTLTRLELIAKTARKTSNG